MTRRDALMAFAAAAFSPKSSRLSVEGYIFVQYADRQKKTLGELADETLAMTRAAGFRNIELNQGFFAPGARDQVLAALNKYKLRMPSVYVGGGMHTGDLAEQTTARALEIAKLCAPFGCVAVVNNPDPKRQAEKTDDELRIQAIELNKLGETLKQAGFELRVHNHTPELVSNAREWRHILHNTDPNLVSFCLDLDWVHQGGFAPLALLREGGSRVTEVHVRSSKNKLWLEDFADGDTDYREIARYFQTEQLKPLIVVELAYRPQTVVTRSLADDLRLSRIYAETVFRAGF